MGKKVSSISIILSTISGILLVIGVISIYRINQEHQEKLIYSMHEKVNYYAKRCYLENKCSGEVTLEDLYKYKYLDIIYDPITKEEVNPSTKINYIDSKININWE